MQSYGGARTGAGQRSVVLAFSKQSMTDDDHDDDDQESIGRRPKRAALTVVVLGFFAQNHLVVQLVRRSLSSCGGVGGYSQRRELGERPLSHLKERMQHYIDEQV
jgi:hypothetical protein